MLNITFTLFCQKYWQPAMEECIASNTHDQWEESQIEVGRWRDSRVSPFQRALVFSVGIKSCHCPSPSLSPTALTPEVAVCDSIQLDLISTGLVAQLCLVYTGLQRGTDGLNLPDSTSEKGRYFIVRTRSLRRTETGSLPNCVCLFASFWLTGSEICLSAFAWEPTRESEHGGLAWIMLSEGGLTDKLQRNKLEICLRSAAPLLFLFPISHPVQNDKGKIINNL